MLFYHIVPHIYFDPFAGRSDISLVSLKVDGRTLAETEYQLTAKKLILGGLPAGDFVIEIEIGIKPQVGAPSPCLI